MDQVSNPLRAGEVYQVKAEKIGDNEAIPYDGQLVTVLVDAESMDLGTTVATASGAEIYCYLRELIVPLLPTIEASEAQVIQQQVARILQL